MTSCIAPEEISAWQLEAYIAGERDPAVVAHLRRCLACRQAVAASAQLERQLEKALFRLHCPSVETLLEYQWGFLAAREAQGVATHLAACPYCAAEAAHLAPPPAEAAPSWGERLQSLLARLLPTGPTLELAPVRAGVRGQTSVTQCYTVDIINWDLTLTWLPGPGAAYTLQGQLLGPTPEDLLGAQATVLGPTLHLTAPLDTVGVFTLAPLPPGEYVLQIRIARYAIHTLPVDMSDK